VSSQKKSPRAPPNSPIAQAATNFLDAPDSAFGQAWHMPCVATRTTREILKIAADALGAPLRIR